MKRFWLDETALAPQKCLSKIPELWRCNMINNGEDAVKETSWMKVNILSRTGSDTKEELDAWVTQLVFFCQSCELWSFLPSEIKSILEFKMFTSRTQTWLNSKLNLLIVCTYSLTHCKQVSDWLFHIICIVWSFWSMCTLYCTATLWKGQVTNWSGQLALATSVVKGASL